MFDFVMPELSWRDAVIPKKSGGVRHIHIPNDALKEVQGDILQYLYLLYKNKAVKVSAFAHGFVPWRNTMSSVLRHSRYTKVLLCMDVKDFFDNFPLEPVKKALLSSGIGEVLTDKILTACTLDGHFPQGAPTSPFLTNLGMFEVDLMLAAYALRHDMLYTRYADDITFSLMSSAELPQATEEDKKNHVNPYTKIFYGVETILKSHLGLELKHKKDHVIWRNSRCKPEILGIVLRQDNKGYNADKKLRLNTRAGVHNLAKKVRKKRGHVFPEDHTKWRELLGSINYMDYVRSFSDEDVNGADPCISEKDFNYIAAKFAKGGRNGA